jgi:hypothetical protein
MLGSVLPPPPFVSITFADLPKVIYKPPGTDLNITVTVNVNNSAIDVECDMNRFDEQDIGHVHKIAFDTARAAVNLISFLKGYGLTVYLHTLVRPDGTRSVLVPQSPQLESICTAFSTKPAATREENDFNTVASLVFADPALFMALDDLILSQILPHQGPVTCARAVEGIRNMIAPGMKRPAGWETMREHLKLDRAYLDLVTETSTASRHGDRTFVPPDVTLEIQKRAWVVMNRFLEYRKRKNQPLPLDEFPILSS